MRIMTFNLRCDFILDINNRLYPPAGRAISGKCRRVALAVWHRASRHH